MAKEKPGFVKTKPVAFTRAVAEDICDWIASGKSVNAYCRQKGKIAKSAIFKHLAREPWFLEMYEAACSIRSHALVDEIIDIADTETDGLRARNRIHARQWYAGKLNGKYTDKAKVEHEGGITVEIVHFGPKADEDQD